MMRTLRLIILLSALVNSVMSFAAEHEITISVGEWPPFLSEQQRHQGFIAHMIADIFAAEDIEVRFEFLPWGRAYTDAADGYFAATAIWMHQPDRETDFHYSDPVLEEQFVFFHLAEQAFDWASVEDLAGMALGGGIGYSYGSDFDRALESGLFSLERVSSTQQNFLRLLAGYIDAFPEERSVGYYTLNQNLHQVDASFFTHHPLPLLNNNSFLLFPRSLDSSGDLMARFNRRLQIFRDTGRYQQYFEDFDAGLYTLPDAADER